MAATRYPTPFYQRSGVPLALALALGVLAGGGSALVQAVPEPWGMFAFAGFAVLMFMLAVGDVKKTLLAAVLLEIPIQLDDYFDFQPQFELYGSIGGYNVAIATMCIAVLFGLLSAEIILGKHPRGWAKGSLPLLTYFTITALSIFAADNKALAGYEITLMAQGLLIFLYVLYSVRTRKDIIFVVQWLLLGVIVQSCIMFGLLLNGDSAEFFNIQARLDPGPRVGGTLKSPNEASAYFSLLLMSALGALLSLNKPYVRLLGLTAFGVGSVAMITTFSRGGWMAFGVALLIFVIAATRSGWMSVRVPILLALVGMGIAAFYAEPIIERIFGDDQNAARGRIPLMFLAWEIIQDHAWFGVGANNYADIMFDYITPRFSREWLFTVHNKYMLVWAETGIFGLVAFLWFLCATLWRGWRTVMSGDPIIGPIVLGLTAGIAGQMVHMNVDIFRSRPLVHILWIVAALIIASVRLVPDYRTYDNETTMITLY